MGRANSGASSCLWIGWVWDSTCPNDTRGHINSKVFGPLLHVLMLARHTTCWLWCWTLTVRLEVHRKLCGEICCLYYDCTIRPTSITTSFEQSREVFVPRALNMLAPIIQCEDSHFDIPLTTSNGMLAGELNFFFFFLCHLLNVGAWICHIAQEGQVEWTKPHH